MLAGGCATDFTYLTDLPKSCMKTYDGERCQSKKRLAWCLQKRRITVNQYWRNSILSDELQVVLG